VADDDAFKVKTQDIWFMTEEELASTKDYEKYEDVLRLHCTPAPTSSDALVEEGYRAMEPWAGIMTHMPGSFKDRSKDKYFEFWAKTQDRGKLHIDFGVIGEDLAINGGMPNGVENSEDSTRLYERKEELDIGLDKLSDSLEFLLVPDMLTGQFDTLAFNDQRLNPDNAADRTKDPGRDNWKEYRNGSATDIERRRFTNGLDGDGNRTLNSEDINLDGTWVSSRNERYYRAVIDFGEIIDSALGDTTAYNFVGDSVAARNFLVKESNSAHKGWMLFRIPLHDNPRLQASANAQGVMPSLLDIQGVRLYWADFDSTRYEAEHRLALTSMQFVGNQWQEVPMATTGPDSGVYKIEVSTVNRDDDTL
jgi:cell surface protein SprA